MGPAGILHDTKWRSARLWRAGAMAGAPARRQPALEASSRAGASQFLPSRLLDLIGTDGYE